MPCFVFRYREDGTPEILYFDGLALEPIGVPADLVQPADLPLRWGTRRDAGFPAALALCLKCGVPAELLGEVARLFLVEWLALRSSKPQTIPAWVIQQEVVRITLRVMTDLNGN